MQNNEIMCLPQITHAGLCPPEVPASGCVYPEPRHSTWEPEC